MAAITYLTSQITYGFGDIGSRNNIKLKQDDVKVTIPRTDLERIIVNLKDIQSKSFFKKN